jgi:hypothetical protein
MISLNSINRVVYVMENRRAFSELVNGLLNVTDTTSCLAGLPLHRAEHGVQMCCARATPSVREMRYTGRYRGASTAWG